MYMTSQVVLVVRNPHANAGDIRDAGSIPGREDPLEEGMGNHSCLENPMKRGTWQAMVHIYIYLMECYSAIKNNEILPFATTLGGHYAKCSKSDKAKYCVISLIRGI